MIFTGEQAAVILGVAPQTSPDVPRETPLELWERLVYGRQDRNADFKALLRAVESGLKSEFWSFGQTDPRACAAFAPWHEAAAWDVDGPPPWLVVRVQHDLAVAGLQGCEGGILLAWGAWRRFSMRADPRRQAVIARALAEFTRAVETRTPPAVTGEADLAVVKRLFSPTAAAGEVDLGEVGTAEWRVFSEHRARARRVRAQLDEMEARLRQRLGGAAIGRLVGGRRLALRVVRAPGGHVGSRLVELH